MYQQKYPIYQNNKAVRDMVIVLMKIRKAQAYASRPGKRVAQGYAWVKGTLT
jgi:hypothetical protein